MKKRKDKNNNIACCFAFRGCSGKKINMFSDATCFAGDMLTRVKRPLSPAPLQRKWPAACAPSMHISKCWTRQSLDPSCRISSSTPRQNSISGCCRSCSSVAHRNESPRARSLWITPSQQCVQNTQLIDRLLYILVALKSSCRVQQNESGCLWYAWDRSGDKLFCNEAYEDARRCLPIWKFRQALSKMPPSSPR